MENVDTKLEHNDYLNIKAVSSGGLKRMLKSPAHFRHWQENQKEATPAMQFGTLAHTAVLEPHKLRGSYVVAPEDAPDKRSKGGREWWRMFTEEAGKRPVISAEDEKRLFAVRDAVFNHQSASGLLDCDGVTEATLQWIDPKHNLRCKARPDFIASDYSFLIDLKTCQSATPEDFQRTAWQHRYDMQAAFYLEAVARATGNSVNSFIWIAVESEAPHGVAVFRAEPDVVLKGWEDCDRGMELYATCLEQNEWPSYPAGIQTLSLPRWVKTSSKEQYF